MEALQIIFILFIIFTFLYLLNRLVRISLFFNYLNKTKNTSGFPPVSVVISARNEAQNLKELIPVLFRQQYPTFEVVVALDRCTDESLSIMKTFEKEYSQLKTVIVDELPDHFSPKKYALTLAIKAARYEWILLTDADCRPLSEVWIEKFSELMTEENQFILGYSPYQKSRGLLNGFIQFETFQTAYEYFTSSLLGLTYMGVGRNLAYRKSLFLKVKGYNRFQGIMGGDDDLFVQYHANSTNTALMIDPQAVTESASKDNWKDYRTQKKRHYSVSRYYQKKVKLIHIFKFTNNLGLFITFVILAFWGYQWIWVFSLILLVILFRFYTDFKVGQRLGRGYNYTLLPVFDLIYILFVPLSVMDSMLSKTIKWKN
jgi:glycosyltransferase involved in cell wall biosynthesis